ncbi:MAG: hypothetical protein M3N18_10505 [Actinomycetota bacterium]|nr:hypothetical protein [Actinomycetota bacterium]
MGSSDLPPVVGKQVETRARLFFGLFVQLAFPDEPAEGDRALDPRPPPHGYVAIFPQKARNGG